MEHKEITCTGCPMGCMVQVELEGENVYSVTGNGCMRGEVYARTEVVRPTRIVTSTVQVKGGDVLSVKTKEAIPKEKIMDCMEALKKVSVQPPVHIGDIVLEDVANTGVPIVATKSIL